jgi:uncharacterized membrane protein
MTAATNPVQVKNLELVERWASVLGGATLIAYGMKKRSAGRTMLAVLGGDLVYRGLSGQSGICAALGLHSTTLGRSASIPYQTGIRVDKAVTINKSREELFAFWRNLENLPRFMKHLHSVTQIDDRRSHWVAGGPAGKIVEWDAEIINEETNELIGWRSLPGSQVKTAGSVHFKTAPDGRGTELKVELQYDPPGGLLGATFAKLWGEDPARQIGEDLRRFKQFMETGEIPTTEGQPHGKESLLRRAPVRARRAQSTRHDDKVVEASEDSFPASDAPAWSAPATNRAS